MALEKLDNDFKEEFLRVFEIMRKKEMGKFQFYRKITSEMVVAIDKITRALG